MIKNKDERNRHVKKRYIVLMIVIAALLVCVGSFFLITKGKVSVKDGVRQNSRLYMTDVKMENGKVSFTVVNKTFYNVGIGEKPDVQKKIDGEWKPFRLYQSINDIGIRVAISAKLHVPLRSTWMSDPRSSLANFA